MCDEHKFSHDDLRDMVRGGIDGEFIESITGQHVMFVHQNYDQMRLLHRFVFTPYKYSRTQFGNF